jgi:hypothetical protein
VKNERRGGIKGKKDKARIGKAARTSRVLARLDALKTRVKTIYLIFIFFGKQ